MCQVLAVSISGYVVCRWCRSPTRQPQPCRVRSACAAKQPQALRSSVGMALIKATACASLGRVVSGVAIYTHGAIDVDLGGGLIKQRVARTGQVRSGGFRMIVAYRVTTRAVFLYGFAKNDRDNIGDSELQALRAIGANWLAASSEVVGQAMADGDLQEIES